MKPARALLLSVLLAGCAATNLAPLSGAGTALEDDEQRLWRRSEEEQRALDGSGLLYRSEELEAYLDQVARRLQPAEVYARIPFRVRVVSNPRLNAFAFPNGVIYVHTGLLARLDNEAQLAVLLGHEMTHATHRHAVKEFRETKTKRAWLASVQTTLGGVPGIGGLAGVLGEVGATAAVTGYSRDLEREADIEGLRRGVAAGYDAAEATKLFHLLARDAQQEKVQAPLFYATHPRLQERIQTVEEMVRTEYRDRAGATNAGVFRKKTNQVVLDNAWLDLKAGRFTAAQQGAEKYVALSVADARGHYLLGEVLRQKGEQAATEQAMAHYRKAIAADRAYPEPHRGLGLLHFQLAQKPQARRALETYLSLSPQAGDRAYIEEYIQQCK
jgi:Zn-dependent protease with chaperone function